MKKGSLLFFALLISCSSVVKEKKDPLWDAPGLVHYKNYLVAVAYVDREEPILKFRPTLLFSMGEYTTSGLDEQRLPSTFREGLEEIGISIAPRAQVEVIKRDRQWSISTNKGTFVVKHEKNEVNVYDPEAEGKAISELDSGKLPKRIIQTMDRHRLSGDTKVKKLGEKKWKFVSGRATYFIEKRQDKLVVFDLLSMGRARDYAERDAMFRLIKLLLKQSQNCIRRWESITKDIFKNGALTKLVSKESYVRNQLSGTFRGIRPIQYKTRGNKLYLLMGITPKNYMRSVGSFVKSKKETLILQNVKREQVTEKIDSLVIEEYEKLEKQAPYKH